MPEVLELDPPQMIPEPILIAKKMQKLKKNFEIELSEHILDTKAKIPDKIVFS